MAIFKTCLSIFALLLPLTILETGSFIESPSQVLPEHNEEESFLPHTRGKRSVATNQLNYTLDVVLNASDVAIIQQFQSSLNSFPLQLGNNTEISEITFTTVCSSTATGFQCRCEDNFAWPYSTCVTYGACDSIVSGSVHALMLFQLMDSPARQYQVEYDVDIELNFTDIGTVDVLRSILDAGGFSIALGPNVNVTHITITTACDDIIDNTCGCINSIPTNGQYCVPQTDYYRGEYQRCGSAEKRPEQSSFPVQISSSVNILDANITTVCSQDNTGFHAAVKMTIFGLVINFTACPLITTPSPTTLLTTTPSPTICSPSSAGYQCRCEDQYRWSCDQCLQYTSCDNITGDTCGCINAIPPDGQYCQPSGQNICSPSSAGYQCRCEDQYRWSCDQCLQYTSCDNITGDTCGCINAIPPDGQYCQPSGQNICSPSSAGYQCRCEDQYRWSCDQCLQYTSCDNITGDTCGCINAIPPDGQYCQPSGQNSNSFNNPITNNCSFNNPITNNSITNNSITNNSSYNNSITNNSPPIIFEYIILVELNTTDVTLINQLSTILRSIRYPFILNNTQILDFALQAVLVTSADVRISIVGHVTSVYSIHPVTTSLGTHVDASMPFLLMDNTASLLVKTNNSITNNSSYHNSNTNKRYLHPSSNHSTHNCCYYQGYTCSKTDHCSCERVQFGNDSAIKQDVHRNIERSNKCCIQRS
ncbi:hypothetical protein F7725_019202 [Dissostichus mawsoni]|uniref:ADGRF3/5-like N-terminal domain-containing protein n=1 Tax=Dissostichus mawsoni TaxID=36200 RepID=A0A7J5YJZ4_DISMA|nr:hypothetical protein F7725_019202 [Dissostichus mawsoni]